MRALGTPRRSNAERDRAERYPRHLINTKSILIPDMHGCSRARKWCLFINSRSVSCTEICAGNVLSFIPQYNEFILYFTRKWEISIIVLSSTRHPTLYLRD